jgi:hypothetical protein
MSSKKNDDQKLADQANELYWRSGQSVNQIAEAMDLSKSGLYALIRPLPAERNCPNCGEGLVFPNRTTEHKAIASCLECKSTGEAPEPGTELDTRTALRQENGGRGLRSNRVLWASVLLGVAAGLYVTRRFR